MDDMVVVSTKPKPKRRKRRRRRFGKIFKRPGGPGFLLQVPTGGKTKSGRPRYATKSFRTREEAEAALKQVEKEVLLGTFGMSATPEQHKCETTLLDAIDAYVETKRGEGCAERGITRYLTSRSAIARSPIGGLRACDLRPADIERFMRWRRAHKFHRRGKGKAVTMRGATTSNATVNRDLALISAALARLVRLDELERNVARGIKRGREPVRSRAVLSKDEVANLLDACEDHFRPFVMAAYFTGQRPRELLALKWGDASFGNETLTVFRSKVGVGDSIPMHSRLAAALKALKEQRAKDGKRVVRDDEHVFLSKHGRPNFDYRTPWLRAVKRAGLHRRQGLTPYGTQPSWVGGLLCVLLVCSAADAVEITKPSSGEAAVNENFNEGAIVTNSGHYATASGTAAPYNWTSIPVAAVVWDFTPDPDNRHTVRFMVQTGYTGSVTLKVTDTGDGSSHTVSVNPVQLSWVDNYGGWGMGAGPDRIVNHSLGGLRGTRKVFFRAIGSGAIADLRIRTYVNKMGGAGRIEVLEYDDEASSVAKITPPCGTGEWKVTVPVTASGSPGTLHSITIRGETTSSLTNDIEIDLVNKQIAATLCYDGIGAVMEYTVVNTDLVFDGLDEQAEESGSYLLVGGGAPPAVIQEVLPSDYQGWIRLDKVDPQNAIVTATQTGVPVPLFHDVSANSELPFNFYVQAIAASADVEDIELFCAPYEGFFLGGGTCRDGIKLTAVQATVKRDVAGGSVEWEEINGSVAVVVIGQKVNLKAEIEPDTLNASAFQWSIEGLKKFKDYAADGDSATLTELDADDLDDQIIDFYWAQGTGVGEAVACVVTFNLLGLTSINASDVLSVQRPTYTTSEAIGLVDVGEFYSQFPNTIFFALKPSGGINSGMLVECELEDPDGLSGGHWHMVQLVTVNTKATKLDGTKLKLAQNGETVLDTNYPYLPLPKYPDPGWPGKFEASGVQTVTDEPHDPLTEYQRYEVDEPFRMYVMYLPPGEDSKWVPIGYWGWFWKGTATLSDGEWSLADNDQDIGALTVTNEHPTWTEAFRSEWVPDNESE